MLEFTWVQNHFPMCISIGLPASSTLDHRPLANTPTAGTIKATGRLSYERGNQCREWLQPARVRPLGVRTQEDEPADPRPGHSMFTEVKQKVLAEHGRSRPTSPQAAVWLIWNTSPCHYAQEPGHSSQTSVMPPPRPVAQEHTSRSAPRYTGSRLPRPLHSMAGLQFQ